MTSVTIDREASWQERSATVVVFLALGVAVGTWAAAIPVLKTKLGLSAADLSITLLALALASVLSTVVTGALAPRFGTGRSTWVAAVATMVAFALPAFAQSFVQLTLCACAIGVAIGALDIAANAHASDIEQRWRAPIMSSFHAAFSVGGLLGAALGGVLVWAEWGIVGQIVVPMLLASLGVVAALPNLGQGARVDAGQGIALALPDRAALPLGFVAMCCFLLEGAMADWSAVYLATEKGATPWASAAGYAGFAVAMAAGRLVGDIVVREVGAVRTVFYGGILASAGGALALGATESAWGAAGFALVGLGISNIVPIVFSRAGRCGSSPAAGVAMVATSGYAGFLGGPALVGAIATASNLQIAMGAVLIMPALAMLAALRLDDASA